MSLAEEQHQLPAPVVPAAGPLPDAVTEEELMSSGHELPHEGYTCPLCCLPIALPAAMNSKFKSCCSKSVCHGCIHASRKRGLGDTCAFCRTPTPDSGAATLALVRKRVDAKDPLAIESLASAYCDGDFGLQQDTSRAIELWTEAARLGDLSSHFNLGFLYFEGKCVEQDMAKGIRHWQHAAMQGHPSSRFLLGVHEHNNGNHELAVRHWMVSAKMGHEVSLNEIKEMFMKAHATKAQYAKALRAYQNALEETKSPQREEANAFFNENLSSSPDEGVSPSDPLSSDSKDESGHRVASLLPGATGERAEGPAAVSWGNREHQGSVSGRGDWAGPSCVSLRAPRRDGNAPRRRPASSVCCPPGQGSRPGSLRARSPVDDGDGIQDAEPPSLGQTDVRDDRSRRRPTIAHRNPPLGRPPTPLVDRSSPSSSPREVDCRIWAIASSLGIARRLPSRPGGPSSFAPPAPTCHPPSCRGLRVRPRELAVDLLDLIRLRAVTPPAPLGSGPFVDCSPICARRAPRRRSDLRLALGRSRHSSEEVEPVTPGGGTYTRPSYSSTTPSGPPGGRQLERPDDGVVANDGDGRRKIDGDEGDEGRQDGEEGTTPTAERLEGREDRRVLPENSSNAKRERFLGGPTSVVRVRGRSSRVSRPGVERGSAGGRDGKLDAAATPPARYARPRPRPADPAPGRRRPWPGERIAERGARNEAGRPRRAFQTSAAGHQPRPVRIWGPLVAIPAGEGRGGHLRGGDGGGRTPRSAPRALRRREPLVDGGGTGPAPSAPAAVFRCHSGATPTAVRGRLRCRA
ncbi:hypothetical protein THAOC_22685 [Thalassiosira oceanica]|uniref:RING-type domain-containing protein n=1 Tax=Thalassiosira oceanica TaxID=159749 RepID=K0SF99_THAOC|nr:hypothetical protein THAOC_22685 [Thalassiosira oceanica]|eukprot:EJK57287.1 hypothetical protein THAOC_22685 [Thalassiosira oceanica]